MREEKETLLMSGAQSSAGREELLSAVASLTAERDQLKMDLQENVEMVSYRATALPVQILNAFISISCVGPLLCAFCLCRSKDFFFSTKQMIENQEELRTALEKNREQKELIKQLQTAQTSKQDGPPSEMSAQQEELQTHVRVF